MATFRVVKVALKNLFKQKGVFQGTLNGVPRIYRRPKRGKRSRDGYISLGKTDLTLLVVYEPKKSY